MPIYVGYHDLDMKRIGQCDHEPQIRHHSLMQTACIHTTALSVTSPHSR